MAALPWMQLFPADYLADTAHLTRAQSGSYMFLLMNYWQTGRALDNSGERLAIVARMSLEEWEAEKPILAEFFTIRRDKWIHKRVENDLQKVFAKSTKASHSASEGARKRANVRLAFAERNLSNTDTDTYTQKNLEVLDLCNLLADCVEANLKEKSKNPEKVKRPEISEAWISQMDLLIRKDGHSVEEVKEIIGWTQADEFWSSNVMSPAKLRRQFDQLILKKPKGPVKPKALPHLRIEDFNGPYCQSCNQTWPCLTESRKSENPF